MPLYRLALSALLLGCTHAQAEIKPERAKELTQLVRTECATCHGDKLQGTAQGPTLQNDSLGYVSRESLLKTLLQGRPNTKMEGWSKKLSEEEAGWIVDQLLKGFPAP